MVSLFPDKIFTSREVPQNEPTHSLFPEHAYEQPLAHHMSQTVPEGFNSEGCLVPHRAVAHPVVQPPGVQSLAPQHVRPATPPRMQAPTSRAASPPRTMPGRGKSMEYRTAVDPRHSYSMPALHPSQGPLDQPHDKGRSWDGTIEELFARIERDRAAMSTALASQIRSITEHVDRQIAEHLDRQVVSALEASMNDLRQQMEAQRSELEAERADKLATLSALRSDLDHQRSTIRDLAVGFQPAAEPDAEVCADESRFKDLEKVKEQQTLLGAMIEDLRREVSQASTPRRCESVENPLEDAWAKALAVAVESIRRDLEEMQRNMRSIWSRVSMLDRCEERMTNLEEGFLARQEAHESLRNELSRQQVYLSSLETTVGEGGGKGKGKVEEVLVEARQVMDVTRKWRTDLEGSMAKVTSQCTAFQASLDAMAAGHERLHLRIGALDEGLGRVEANTTSLEQFRHRFDRLDGTLACSSGAPTARGSCSAGLMSEDPEAPHAVTAKVMQSPHASSSEASDATPRVMTVHTTASASPGGSLDLGPLDVDGEEGRRAESASLSLATRVQQMHQQHKTPLLAMPSSSRGESVDTGPPVQATRRFSEQLRARRGMATSTAA